MTSTDLSRVHPGWRGTDPRGGTWALCGKYGKLPWWYMSSDGATLGWRSGKEAENAGLAELSTPATAWNEGFEAASEWVANNPGPSGIPSDPPRNPYANAPENSEGTRKLSSAVPTVDSYTRDLDLLPDGRYYDGTYEWDKEGDEWFPLRAPSGMPDQPYSVQVPTSSPLDALQNAIRYPISELEQAVAEELDASLDLLDFQRESATTAVVKRLREFEPLPLNPKNSEDLRQVREFLSKIRMRNGYPMQAMETVRNDLGIEADRIDREQAENVQEKADRELAKDAVSIVSSNPADWSMESHLAVAINAIHAERLRSERMAEGDKA